MTSDDDLTLDQWVEAHPESESLADMLEAQPKREFLSGIPDDGLPCTGQHGRFWCPECAQILRWRRG